MTGRVLHPEHPHLRRWPRLVESGEDGQIGGYVLRLVTPCERRPHSRHAQPPPPGTSTCGMSGSDLGATATKAHPSLCVVNVGNHVAGRQPPGSCLDVASIRGIRPPHPAGAVISRRRQAAVHHVSDVIHADVQMLLTAVAEESARGSYCRHDSDSYRISTRHAARGSSGALGSQARVTERLAPSRRGNTLLIAYAVSSRSGHVGPRRSWHTASSSISLATEDTGRLKDGPISLGFSPSPSASASRS